jgi:hypothetical protein
VRTDTFWSWFGGCVADRAFQRRLHRTHQVIVRDHPFRAVKSHSQQTAAGRHQRGRTRP